MSSNNNTDRDIGIKHIPLWDLEFDAFVRLHRKLEMSVVFFCNACRILEATFQSIDPHMSVKQTVTIKFRIRTLMRKFVVNDLFTVVQDQLFLKVFLLSKQN